MNIHGKASKENTYDAIVVGSGISGGWAAKELTQQGLKVLLLERGRPVEHVTDYPTAQTPAWELKHRGRVTPFDRENYPLQGRNYNVNEANRHFYVNEKEHPYVQTRNDVFTWVRGYQVGGRSLTWGRHCYRWSDLDFEANAKEGIAVDWPIRYRDIAPWYSYVEKFTGISGSRENLPHLPDSEFLPPMELNCLEAHFKSQVTGHFGDRQVIPGRVANLTTPIEGRGVCQYRNLCDRGCPYGGYFSSNAATLPAAAQTGNLTLKPHSVVLRVLHDEAKGKASGVEVLDTQTMQTVTYHARVIFLNASTIATTMIMLQSVSGRFPAGLGNDSGELGHNLMTHPKTGAGGAFPGLTDKYYYGRKANGLYIPRFRNVGSKHPGYLRGFNYQGGATRNRKNPADFPGPGLGAEFKEFVGQPGAWSLSLSGFGEQLPYHDNQVRVSQTVRDVHGLPVAEIDFEWKDNELKMAEDMVASAREMLEAAGCTDIKEHYGVKALRTTAHEMGTARMGRDPRTSVLNPHNQVWGCPNVYVTDGACMTSNSCVNPSLTYMALTARACDHAVGQMKQRVI
ncbi:MAG: Glucose-methanol-choline (GMC) oxidoreductase:NAD binding site [uncultured Cytophagales bacterium]|uniref:Glucose-methanol-choline (GMC) oxidoreductase:NAD binding site n=1 Tax=uncultured Cytophagales bacterium TaxID=158755 RepID=A0A6J4JFT2_9SPHI|nr:MAG: Glucose-methanol-choline (GMC) oxidoreductase:NAD binding site [uncultured Cytophagales bacterium]